MCLFLGSASTTTGKIPSVGPVLGSVEIAGSQTKILSPQLFVMTLAAPLKNRSARDSGVVGAGCSGLSGFIAGEPAGSSRGLGELTRGFGVDFLIALWMFLGTFLISSIGAAAKAALWRRERTTARRRWQPLTH